MQPTAKTTTTIQIVQAVNRAILWKLTPVSNTQFILNQWRCRFHATPTCPVRLGVCGFQIITKLSTEPPKAKPSMPSLSQHPNGTVPHVLAMLMGISILSIGCESENEDKQQDLAPSFFEAPGSWRAAEAVNASEAWFASSNGHWQRIYKTQTQSTQQTFGNALQDTSASAIEMHFRGLVKTPEALLGTVIGSPGLIQRGTFDSDGTLNQPWTTVWREDHPNAFLDAIIALDDQTLVAMGDPIDSCLYVVRSDDGGRTWAKVPCADQAQFGVPTSRKGEAAFAASNGNLSAMGDTVWMLSGGGASRVYRSENRGHSWQAYETPLQQGGDMTGGFSMDFANAQRGILWGGNWQDKPDNTARAAVTSDGGTTWTLIAEGQGPGYASSVRYRPGSAGRQLALIGSPSGIDVSDDAGASWRHVSDSAFYTGRFSPDGAVLWLSGNEGMARFSAASLGW